MIVLPVGTTAVARAQAADLAREVGALAARLVAVARVAPAARDLIVDRVGTARRVTTFGVDRGKADRRGSAGGMDARDAAGTTIAEAAVLADRTTGRRLCRRRVDGWRWCFLSLPVLRI